MAGDLFGNGMLQSRATRLVAAFNHAHIFIDPDPDAGKTFPERERLFKLPRSSWRDYDAKLISAGADSATVRSTLITGTGPSVTVMICVRVEVSAGVPESTPVALSNVRPEGSAPLRLKLGAGVPLAVVTGPSFAKEVALGLPTAVTVHGADPGFAQAVADALHGPAFRAYTGNDMVGAELGGAMKNVLAVATGVADGMELGLNARAGLITRGLNEMLRLNNAIGGRPETLMGLAGLGDLVLTCTGDLSRNRRLGLALGRGQAMDAAIAQIGQVVESVQTADEVMRQAERHGIELPISSAVRAVLHGEITPADGLRRLLAREQKPEYPTDLFG